MLNGKVAVVTGASRGIGRQIAISMAKEGAVVIVNYNGSAAKAEDVVKEITEAGGQAEAVQCNVSDYSAAEAFLKDIISRYKRIDILVNNAGITRDNLLMKMTEEESYPVPSLCWAPARLLPGKCLPTWVPALPACLRPVWLPS